MELSAQIAFETTARIGLEADLWDPHADTFG
jgi:hypothetical protein